MYLRMGLLGFLICCVTMGIVFFEKKVNTPGSDLPHSLDEAKAFERADALPLTGFYDPPTSFDSTKPGELLRMQGAPEYQLPHGARAIRFLYHSRDADDRDVATSGVILIPSGIPPKDGWPVIAWAHGSSGTARTCAPSLMKDLDYGEEGLEPMVRAGFAVVATDYHGLGTDGEHPYLSKVSQARDVIYAVPAARAAEASIGRRWVVVGHGQGGLAAWGVAELERNVGDATYLGAVAVAPAIVTDKLAELTEVPSWAAMQLNYIAFGIHARWPDFKVEDMLGGKALEHHADVTAHGCWDVGYANYLDSDEPERLKPGWGQLHAVKAFIAANAVGSLPVAPLLVITGESDQYVPSTLIKTRVAQACDQGSTLDFWRYQGLDSDAVMTNSTSDQLRWIARRFAGKVRAPHCDPEGRLKGRSFMKTLWQVRHHRVSSFEILDSLR